MGTTPQLLVISEDQGNSAALAVIETRLRAGNQITWICATPTSADFKELESASALKNRYLAALSLFVITSKETQPFDVLTGPLTQERLNQCAGSLFEVKAVTEAVIAASGPLQAEIAAWLGSVLPEVPATVLATAKEENKDQGQTESKNNKISVTVIMQGREFSFSMSKTAGTLLDGADDAGVDLPFSCRGGVCSTCRVQLAKGNVNLLENYALEEWELDAGFTLPCQAEPLTDQITLDYDQV